MHKRLLDSEGEFPEGRTVRRDLALFLRTLVFLAITTVFFALGCLFLIRFGLTALGLPLYDPCCNNLLDCRPCGDEGPYYPALFISLFSFFVSAAPWLALRIYRRATEPEV